MRVSAAFETRPYPETRPSCPTEKELEVMASPSLRASPGNKSHLIEPGPNPKRSRKVFENSILSLVTTFMCALDPTG